GTSTSSYTGTTQITNGVLNIQNANALGNTSSGTTVSSGATLQLQGGITVGSEALNLSGAGYTGQNGALVNVSGTNTYGGLLTLGAAATISSDSGTLTLSNTGTISGSGNALTLTGSGNGSLAGIIGTNAGTLTKSGSGTWTLSGANTFTGSTSISGGTLTLANALALQNSTLNYNSLGGSLGFGALTSATLGGLSGGQNLALTNGSSAAVALTVGNNSGSTTYSGVLSGGGSLTKTGSGTLTLSGTNTYTGTTTVSAGTLQIGAGGTTGSIASTSVVDNAALSFNRSNSLSYSGVISGTGTLSQDGAGALTLSGANTFSGITTITGGTLTLANSLALQNSTLNYNSLGGSLSFGSLTSATLGGLSGAQNLTLQNGSSAAVALSVGNNNADTTYSGALSGSGSLTKVGTGTLTLSGTNTYSGATTIQRGTLQAGSANALAGRDIVVNAVGGGTATFAVGAGTSTTIGSLTFGGVGGAATSQNLVTLGNASSTLTLGGNVTYDATGNPLASTISTVSGTGTLDLGSSVRTFNIGDSSNTTNELTIASNLAGSGQSSGGLTKTGAGTLTLSGPSNTFNGLVTVNSGTLAANGTTDTGGFGELGNHNWVTGPAPTTVIAVNSGATLQVNSTFTDSIAGASSNTHQYETLSLNGTGTDGTGALKATGGINTWWGNVTLAGNTTITNTAASGDSNALYLGPLLFSSAPTDFKLNGHALTITGSGDTQISNMIGDSAGDSGSVTVNLSNANALVYFNGIQNYYTGATTVDQGTLFLLVDPGSHANAAILGDLAIGDGSGSADSAKVMTYYSDQIADSASVTIKSDGLLDLGTYGRDETIGALTLAGGHISTHGDNDGNLYLGANVHVTASSVIDGDATNGGINLNSSDSNLAPEVRTFDVDLGQTLTVNAVVHDRGSGFIKDGTGTMVLTRDNTFGYAGIAEVKNGILNIQDSGALGQNGGGLSSKGTVVDSGATLQLQKTGSNIAVGAETLNLSGTGYTSLGALENVSGANSWAGLVTLDANSTINTNAGSLNFTGQMTGSAGSGQTQTLTVTGAGDTTISSRIFDNRVNAGSDSHTGTLALTKNGSGTLTLSNSNSFTGDVRVNAGTLNVTANDGFGYAYHVTHLVSTSNVVYVESGATLGFTTVNTVNYISQLTNTNAATNAAGGVVSLAGNGTQTASSIATLVVNTASHDYFGGSLSGGGLLLKDGAGTLTFTSAANNSTFNFAGTVELAATGGTLEFKGGSGSGTTSTDALTIGTLKLDGGTLALTNAYINVGTLLITGDTVIDFGTGGASILNATNIYVAAGVTVTIRNWTSEYDFLFAKNTGYATSGGFRLTDANGTLATFNAIGSTPESQIWFEGDPQSPDGSHTTWINDQHNSWQDRYTDWEIRPIPEPSTYGALLLGAAGLLVFIRRRRNASAA
ncbi:MAG TPA: autotransporter-associated beta strand repeat-containing protein, partial [Opitutus sp.]|nr:autotransporter-associated beta strand repeat-containing protein [Opitutus sp.]